MFYVILIATLISVGCYWVWAWAHAHLFTYLGEVETCSGIEQCYAYDTLTIPARIVCFLCGCAAIAVFIWTWLNVYAIICL